MKDFKQLRIWQKGFQIAVNTFKLVKDFPKEEKYGLISQMTRSAISITANIAEGSSRLSERDYYRFIEIALGSAYELETYLLIAEEIGYGQDHFRKELLFEIKDEQRMLTGFKNKLARN